MCASLTLTLFFRSQIPSVMTDRYAHLEYDLWQNVTCRSFETSEKPPACFAASADAQQAVANRHLLANAFTFFTSSLVGSLSDEYGRKRKCRFRIDSNQ